MSSFAGDIQVVCLGTLLLLILYTLWLSRYRGLDGHLTVRWILVLGAALMTIVFWRWLPFFGLTSALQERELLLMVTVLLFAFVIFLMLDLLVRSSRQSVQIKRLTQELAIQRNRIDVLAPPISPLVADKPAVQRTANEKPASPMSKGSILASCWIVMCVGFYAYEATQYTTASYPSILRRVLSAEYLH